MLPNIDALNGLGVEESVGVLLCFGNGVKIKDVIPSIFYFAYVISLFMVCVKNSHVQSRCHVCVH